MRSIVAVRNPRRVGYIVKVYPRYSETFIVNEILAHEAGGLPVEIFSLRPSRDSHFQDVIARVRAPITYLGEGTARAETFWSALRDAAALPDFQAGMTAAREAPAEEVYPAIRLAGEVRARGLVHLHAHFASAPASVARIAAAFAGITYSFTAHAKDIFHKSVREEDLERKLADAAAAVTVSEYNLEHLGRRFGASAARLRRIYNGLDLERFPYNAPSKRPPCVIAVGRLVEKKGFATLIAACAHLAARGMGFTCEIIGTGELESALKADIARFGLETRVRLAGPQPQSAVIRAIAGASVVAVPCVVGGDGNRDGLPTVILEAMALGTPCVATDVTGIPEAIVDGRTGSIVPQHDAVALAAQIERLMSDAELRLRLAQAARRRIEEAFDIRRNAGALRAIFEACIESGARATVEV